MTLEPLAASSPAIQFHVAVAVGALALGLAQFALPKGVLLHRVMGWTWVVLMAVAAASSFWVQTIPGSGSFHPFHLVALTALLVLPLGVFYARTGRVQAHRRTMIALFVGGVIVVGLFTLLPGRIMNAVIF